MTRSKERSELELRIEHAKDALSDKFDEVKPKLRGWIHTILVPIVTAAFAVLIALSPTAETRVGASIYAGSAILLFTVSGIYHVGNWNPKAWLLLRRFDHVNIYIFIAGSYTPFAFLYLTGQARWVLLGIVWGCAVAGTVFKIWWTTAPRWIGTVPYIFMGWVVVFFLPQVIDGAERFPTWVNITALSLTALGGLLYTAGGIVYAAKKPDPSPDWFGFHEVFHTLTVLAFAAQYIAVSVATYQLR